MKSEVNFSKDNLSQEFVIDLGLVDYPLIFYTEIKFQILEIFSSMISILHFFVE